jgi:hypothetical protein
MKRANKRQARKIERAILALYDAADLQASIVDALTDLRHLCDVRGIGFHEADEMAYRHYAEEKG